MDTFEAMPYEHRKSDIYKRKKKKNMSKTIPHRQKGHLDTPFFVCVRVASDADHEETAKSNQTIAACINILSHVAK